MMKKAWRKLLAAGCAVSMLISVPGVSVLAGELHDEEIIVEHAEEPEIIGEDTAFFFEDENAEDIIEEHVSKIDEIKELEDVENSEQGSIGEGVGAGNIIVGDNVTATFNSSTGAIKFYSNNGTLDKNWIEMSGVDKEKVKSIEVASGTVYLPENSSTLFRLLENLTSMDLNGFDTSNVTKMTGMFTDCSSLKSLDLTGLDISNVKDTGSMFYGCSALKSLDLRGLDASKVITMYQMFYGCDKLIDLKLDGFITSELDDTANMFENCSSLKSLDLSGFRTQNIIHRMRYMFQGCSSLTDLNLGSIVASESGDLTAMFRGCSSLTNLKLGCFGTTALAGYMFADCSSLTTLDLSNLSWVGSSAQSKTMFENCSSLKTLKTPREIKYAGIALPTIMYDSSGNAYSEIPILSQSISLIVITDITKCIVSLSRTSFTYDGKEKKPAVTVKDGTKTLTLNTDYVVAYADNIKAGEATATVTGKNSYKGIKPVQFTIDKAAPTLKFAVDPVRKQPGDAAFTNKLTSKTDGALSYTSGNKSVATVNSTSGRVTIKGEGSTKITVKAAEGANYKAGTASYTLTVARNGVESCSYKFSNSAESFGYPAGYVIPLEAYYRIYGQNTRAEYTYKTRSQKEWGGNCVGMASTADLLARGAALSPGMFRSGAALNSELSPTDKSSALGISLTQLIESFQIMQYTTAFSDERYGNMVATYDILNSGASLDALYADIKKRTAAGERVILVMAQNGEGHAVLAYGTSEPNTGSAEILIYDNNYPRVERKITLKKGGSGKYTEWSYDMGSHGVWGTGSFSSYMTYITEGTFDRLWENRGNVGKMEADKNIAVTNSRNVAIYNAEGKLEATIVDGKLTTSNEGIMLLDNDISLGKQEQMTYICLPTRTYTVANQDKKITNFDLTMVNTDLGINVSTSAQEVTVAVDDEYAMNTLVMDADASDTYSVTLSNSTGTGYREVVVDGKGQGESIEISQSGKSIILNNCEIGSLMVDGKKVGVYDITAQTSNGGTVSPQGTVSVMRGGSQKYTITPKSGYTISDVFIDGESIGPVKTYTFTNVTSKHTILATFKKSQGTGSQSFSDVQDPSHAFYKAIYWAADAGITKGYPDGTFGIDRSCTRGEMIMFLWRYAGKPSAKALSTSPFKDVPKTHAFYNAIIWASQKGITKGYPDGTFGINRNVSRGECMMFLWRLIGKPAPKDVSVSPFKDVPKTHAFYNAILWGAQKKITNGYTSGPKKGTFGINENCTRGAIVTFLYRAK